jgi:hypothetical protein
MHDSYTSGVLRVCESATEEEEVELFPKSLSWSQSSQGAVLLGRKSVKTHQSLALAGDALADARIRPRRVCLALLHNVGSLAHRNLSPYHARIMSAH